MDTQIRKMTPEEKENVLLVLNEFSEEYKASTKAVTDLVAGVKDLTGKVKVLLEKKEPEPDGESPVATLQKSLDAGIVKIHTAVQRITFPAKEVNQLSGQLESTNLLLQHPLPQKTVHQHHVPHIIWVAVGLFMILTLVCSGWYRTAGKLDRYQEGQLKYRYLKLKSNGATKLYLFNVDSLYRSKYAMQDSVAQWEAEREKATELKQELEKSSGEGAMLQQELKRLERRQWLREQK